MIGILTERLSKRQKNLLLNSIMVFMSIMLVLAGSEAYLRVGADIEPGNYPKLNLCAAGDEKQQQALGDGAKFHSEYGWVSRPNRSYITKHDIFEDWDTYSINSGGFRDRYNQGEQSAIVLGDSFTYGSLAGDNETYPHLLDRWNENVSIHNYGINGYGTAQELLVYQDVGKKIDHDLVILGYVSNDPRNNIGTTASGTPIPSRPVFSVTNGTLVQTRQPQIKSSDPRNTAESALNGKPILKKLNNFLSEHSALHRYVAPTLEAILRQVGVLEPYRAEYDPNVTQRIQLTEALLNQLSREAESNDAQLVIVAIPPREIARQSDAIGTRFAGNQTYWNTQKQMLNAVAEEQSNVELLDLQPEVTERIAQGNPQYGKRDGHFTERGYRTTAELIHQNYFSSELTNEKLTADYGRHSESCPA